MTPACYAAHAAAAQMRKPTIETIEDWRLAFDVDEPAQYAAWQSPQEREHDAA
jgi:hypothetical protein